MHTNAHVATRYLSLQVALGFLCLAPHIAYGESLTTLHEFTGSHGDGFGPLTSLTYDSVGNLYGTTFLGGQNNYGMVFEIAKGSHTYSPVASFNNANGANPAGALVFDGAGNLFGTTTLGGSSNAGTVFEIPKGTNTVNTIATFSNNNGASPQGALAIDAAGNLYGTTRSGGANNVGTIFEVAKGSGSVTTLYSFNSGASGANIYSGLTRDSSGNLFGTAQGGGNKGSGTLFELSKNDQFSVLHTFTGGADGGAPSSTVAIDSSGNLFGTTYFGGTNGYGSVFEITRSTGSFVTLHSFSGSDGGYPFVGVTLDSHGNLYGTTTGRGSLAYGTVFEIAHGTNTFSTLQYFPSGSYGTDPYFGPLASDSAGELFGTSAQGGAANAGSVFEISGVPAIPEPASLLLFGIGLIITFGYAKRSQRLANG